MRFKAFLVELGGVKSRPLATLRPVRSGIQEVVLQITLAKLYLLLQTGIQVSKCDTD